MTKTPTLRAALLAATAAALLTAPAYAATFDNAYSPVPTVETGEGITYITGGIGDEERVAIENTGSEYNLHLTNTDREGAFTDNMNIAIYNARAAKLAEFNAGPLIYAKLPAGKYVVAATNEDGVVRRKTITVKRSGISNVSLVW